MPDDPSETPTDAAIEAGDGAPTDRRPSVDPLAGLRLDPPTWSERLDRLLGARNAPSGRVVAAVAVAALVVAVGLAGGWLLLARRAVPPIEDTLPTAAPLVSSSTVGTTPTTAAAVVAHAAGAVVAPGVYELPGGARVADLIDAAGGLAPDADGHRLNLAGVLADGSRVYVPRVGEVVPPELATGVEPSGPDDPGPGGAVSPGSGRSGGGGGSELVDVNRADVDELETLPGIGPATAQAIVDHRAQHGPFASVDDLIDVRGIGDAKLAQLRDLVTV